MLLALIKRDSGREALRLAAKSAGHIGSDEEKAKVLVDIAGRYKGDREVGRSLLSSAGTIGSDEERRHVLSAVLTNGGSDREIPGKRCAWRRASVRTKRRPRSSSKLRRASRMETWRAAHSLMPREALVRTSSATTSCRRFSSGPDFPTTLAAVATCAKAIGSDEEKAGVLAEMATGSPQSPVARAAFFEAVNTIGSDDERKRVLLVAARHAGNGTETTIEVAKSAKAIGSDDQQGGGARGIGGIELSGRTAARRFLHRRGQHRLRATNAAKCRRPCLPGAA